MTMRQSSLQYNKRTYIYARTRTHAGTHIHTCIHTYIFSRRMSLIKHTLLLLWTDWYINKRTAGLLWWPSTLTCECHLDLQHRQAMETTNRHFAAYDFKPGNHTGRTACGMLFLAIKCLGGNKTNNVTFCITISRQVDTQQQPPTHISNKQLYFILKSSQKYQWGKLCICFKYT